MNYPEVDWEKIKEEYLNSPRRIGFEAMGKKYGIPWTRIRNHSQRERWFAQKSLLHVKERKYAERKTKEKLRYTQKGDTLREKHKKIVHLIQHKLLKNFELNERPLSLAQTIKLLGETIRIERLIEEVPLPLSVKDQTIEAIKEREGTITKKYLNKPFEGKGVREAFLGEESEEKLIK